MYNYQRKTVIILVIIIVIAGLGLLNMQGVSLPYFNWLEKGIYNFTSPVVGFFTGTYRSCASYCQGLLNIDDIVAENEQLKKEAAELELEIKQLESLKNQNNRLRELLAFKLYVNYKTKGAEVIGFGPSNWKQKILINRGKNDGIEEKMPVITYNGALVGRVDYAGANTAQVKLIHDPEFVVGGIVQREESRAIGLVRGQVNNKNISIMEKISWDADIKEGDLVLSSGLSNSYPKGLPIGKVNKVEPDNYGLSLKAEIKLFSGLKTLEEVLVITEF